MTARHARGTLLTTVFCLFLFFTQATAHAENLAYSLACTAVTLGPITLLDTNAFPSTGTIQLTPNVDVPGFSIVTAGGIRSVDNRNLTSGTFTGTLPCTLTIDGVSVGFSQSLSLTIATSGPCTQNDGVAAGCLVAGPAAVEGPLAPAVGKVVVTAPGTTTLGYDAHVTNGGLIVVP